MELELAKVKEYLRVDFDDDDALIIGFIIAAKEYMRNGGVKSEEGELYRVVVMMLVSLFYENREVTDKDIKIPTVINNFIIQLSKRVMP
ncbi:head-tail connector protein [Paenibacillus taichungensis]|uniref:head-tail connector protein n=1 Tax=Paenibacillus taichungensis TaxID=484184 RepID=UPI002DB8B91B|nr:head-tail connector protein [Paenibacillus taichungensis]MEC0107265.1 head-tail connector protein [Paenibacillus taichungensis]MEC0194803.1 head-tail connector protein [Paenibacillus taichungensis]